MKKTGFAYSAGRRRRYTILGILLAAAVVAAGGIIGLNLGGNPFTGPGTDFASGDALEVLFLDVGQGDATIVTCGGHAMLIDAGGRPSEQTVLDAIEARGITRFDMIVATHPHEDHIGGLTGVLRAYDTDILIMPRVETTTKTFENLLDAIEEKGLRVTTPHAGDTYALGGAVITIIAPAGQDYKELNNHSIVLRVTFEGRSLMFTGDAEGVSENEMLASRFDLSAEVLKLAHHGSRSSTTQAFLDAVRPRYAVIFCGAGNNYGHPHDETLEKLSALAVTLYRTDIHGSITATVTKTGITFRTER